MMDGHDFGESDSMMNGNEHEGRELIAINSRNIVTRTDKTPQIICVDDDRVVLLTLRSFASDHGWKVVVVDNPEEGLAWIKKQSFDIVVADLIMPSMTGDQFLVEAHKIDPNMVQVLLSGADDLEGTVRAINSANVFGYLNKPVDEEHFTHVMSKCWASKMQADRVDYYSYQIKEKNKRLVDMGKMLKDRLESSQVLVDEFNAFSLDVMNVTMAAMRSSIEHSGRGMSVEALVPKIFSEVASVDDRLKDDTIKMAHLCLSIAMYEFVNGGNEHVSLCDDLKPGWPKVMSYMGNARLEVGLMFSDKKSFGIQYVQAAHTPVWKSVRIAYAIYKELSGYQQKKFNEHAFSKVCEFLSVISSDESANKVCADNILSKMNWCTDRAAKTFSLHQVEPGMVLVESVTTDTGAVLLEADSILTDEMIDRASSYSGTRGDRLVFKVQVQ